MTQDYLLHLLRESLTTILLIAAPPLGAGLVVGLIISIFQATTQIQEQTLTFVPKIVAVLLTMLFFGAWMLNLLLNFTQQVFKDMTSIVR